MNEQIVTIIVAGISVLGGAGFWSWMQQKSKLAHEKASAEDADRNEFRETLKTQVASLHAENRELRIKIEELMERMSSVQADLAAANATIAHLEMLLRSR